MTNLASDEARGAEMTRELEDLRARQQAVADVLRAMSSSGMRLQPILDEIVEAAARLCRADSGFIYLTDGDLLHMRANVGQPQEVVEYERLHPDRAGPNTCTGRVAMTKRPVHIPDIHADLDYKYPAVEIRTLLGLPVLVEDELVGASFGGC